MTTEAPHLIESQYFFNLHRLSRCKSEMQSTAFVLFGSTCCSCRCGLRPPSSQFTGQMIFGVITEKVAANGLSLSASWRLLIITFLLIKVTFALQDLPSLLAPAAVRSISCTLWLIIGQKATASSAR